MKRILYVTTVSRTINAFLVPHIEMLLNEGYTVDCACCIDKNIDDRLIKRGVKIFNIPFNRNPFNFKNILSYKRIKEIQKLGKYDYIHVHTPVASFITRMALRKKKVNMIYTCHGFHFFKGAPIRNWIMYYPLEKISARWTDTLITINKEDFNVASGFNLRNNGSVYLMHGVGIYDNVRGISGDDKEKYRKKFNLKSDDFIILILAELNSNKNHIQIIEAVNKLINRYKNIKVLCAGEGVLKNCLIEKVSSVGLDKNIFFLGFREDVYELINMSDCIALFSKREGLGKCLLEGMLFGKPILATDTRGARELIVDEENGYIVPIGDIKKTEIALEKLINMSDEYKDNMGSISKEKVKKYYLKNVLSELKRYYEVGE